MLIGHFPNSILAVARMIFFSSRPSWRKSQQSGWGSKHSQPGRVVRKRPTIFDRRIVHNFRLLLLAISLPVLIFIVWYLWPRGRPTPMLVVGVSDYGEPCPINAFAMDDLDRFSNTFVSGDYKNIRLTVPEKQPKESADLKRMITDYLGKTKPGGPNENVVLIYLSLHGVVNAEGHACLLLPGHDPLDCTTWLPFSELFETLTTADKDFKDRKIVLLLDAGQIDDCWEMGILCNTFAIAVESYLEGSPPNNCFVISATSGLDVAMTAGEIGGTPFGYYVAAGLRGKADGVDGEIDEVVSLTELQTYVHNKVDQWARENRGIPQRPFFYAGTEKDLKSLAVADVAEAEKSDLSTRPWKSPIRIKTIDKCVDRMRSLDGDQVWRLNPLGWARAQFLLQRLDAELLGGMAYKNDAQSTLESLEEIMSNLDDETMYTQFAPTSLAMQRHLDGDLDSDVWQAAWEAWIKDPHEAKVPQDYQRAVSFTWDRFFPQEGKDNPPDQKAITDALNFCDAAGDSPLPELVEMALLRLLHKHVDWMAKDVQDFPELGQLLRDLIKARNESEKLAAPEDPRQHYVIAPKLAEIDQQFADAFDQLLVGSGESLVAAKKSIRVALGDGQPNYDQVTTMSKQARRALRLRDQSLASSLHLTRWVVRKAKLDSAQRSKLDQVKQLVKKTHQLAKKMDLLIQQSTFSADEVLNETKLQALTKEVDEIYSELLGIYKKLLGIYENRTIKLSHEDGSKLDSEVEWPLHLRSPISINDDYDRLHKKWFDKLSSDDTRQYSSTSVTEYENTKEYLHWLISDAVPPLANLFNWVELAGGIAIGDVNDETSLAKINEILAALGGDIRQLLRESVPTQPDTPSIRRQCDTLSNKTDTDLKKDPFAKARKSLSQADCLSRGLAPLLTQQLWSKPDYNFAKNLRQLDVHALLVWRGRRLLNDFWGAWDGSPTRFYKSATEHLRQQLKKPYSEAEFGGKALNKLLNNLEPIFNSNWKGALLDKHISLGNDPDVNIPLTIAAIQNFPPGVMAIYLSDRNGTLSSTYDNKRDTHRRWGSPTNPGESDPSFDLQLKTKDIESKLEETPRLKVNTLFRGHQWHSPFNIGRGQIYEWEKPQPAPATVLVKGDSKLISNLIIIFDCSVSMQGERIQRGSDALIAILDQLANQKDQYRVGLILFGHRAGWQENATQKIKRCDPNFSGQPWEDVELVFAPKLLKNQFRYELKNRLRQANTCRGETPLYSALILALESFRRPIPNMPESFRILAVTDGVNWTDDADPIEASDVSDELNQFPGRAQIDVIQFGAPKVFKTPTEKKKWLTGRPELENICHHKNSEGTFYQAEDARKELSDKLRDSLQLHRYTLQPTSGDNTSALGPAELDSRTRIPKHSEPTEYEVLLEGNPKPAQIWVEGGENLRLIYNRRRTRFEYPYFDDNLRGERQESTRGFYIAAHLPGLSGTNPVFRVSVQAKDETHFSRRPEIVWAKIRPANDNSARAYYFMDRKFEAGLPVPMLQFLTQDWPLNSPAHIELYLAMRRDDLNSINIRVRDTESPVKEKVGNASLEIRSERDTTGAFRVVVEEKHEIRGDSFPLHLQIIPTPDKITREFFESDLRARHVFTYEKEPVTPTVQVLTRQEIKGNGVGRFDFENVQVRRQ